MLEQYAIVACAPQVQRLPVCKPLEPAGLSQQYGRLRLCFLEPLVRELDGKMDKRPVRTLVQAVEAILVFRDRNHGLRLA